MVAKNRNKHADNNAKAWSAFKDFMNPYAKTTAKLQALYDAQRLKELLENERKNVIKNTLIQGYNFLTDEGTVMYPTDNPLAITNLSGNQWKTASIRQLNNAAICPVPVQSGMFFHRKTILEIVINRRTPSSNVWPEFIFFVIWTKGTWTPGESAVTGFEAMIKAQNSGIYKLEILDSFSMPVTIDSGGYRMGHEVRVKDLTGLMNRIQAGINQREGMTDEINYPNVYLGVALRDTDNGIESVIGTHMTDVRGLKEIPVRF